MHSSQATEQASDAGQGKVRVISNGVNVALEFSGHWLRGAEIQSIGAVLEQLDDLAAKCVVVRDDGLTAWDSRLPSYLLKIADYCDAKGVALDMSTMSDGLQNLLKLARAVPERAGVRRSEERISLLIKIGNSVLDLTKDSLALVRFVGEVMLALRALLIGRARFRWIDLTIFIQDTGPNALPIVSLISLLVGLILAFVGALQLAMFGAQIYIADLVALGTVREMGPLMTAVIMSGRTGAAYAAQLGTMNVNSEIDALKTMGISPLEFLVLPRMLALILMMPLLTMYADLMGILGGALVSANAFDVTMMQYYNEIAKAVVLTDFCVGFFKSLVFAVLIAVAGCMRGMQCGRSASAVGDAATAAVVDSIIYIVVSDSVMTLICNQLKI
ncbi:MAG: ABC transporter permease [Methylomonas sp.]|nr:ABC transporter permease [Methylomonas sp.]